MPNLVVDVNSWTRSACYPQGSFYPLSYGSSIRNRKITISDFRPCSTCRSRSQASLCYCTRGTISNRAEDTLERLRYSFGGDRPSQTARLTLSPNRIHGCRLDTRSTKSGISTTAPPRPKPRLQSVPPILRMRITYSIVSYSKAPWGLSV